MNLNTATGVTPMTAPAFAARARHRLYATPPPAGAQDGITHPSDFDLNPAHWVDLIPGLTFRPAAVLIAIVARPQPSVLLTQRTNTLPKHAGQISFPGGTSDPADTTPLATALREAHEEIGLIPDYVEPLGYLDAYRSGTGFVITPVVGMIEPDLPLTLNLHEVQSTFEVPLEFLMDPNNHRVETRDVGGRGRQFYAMPYQDRYIWGITAGILRNLYERVVRP